MLRSSGKSADSTELERRSAQRSSERDALESFDWSADLPPWQVEADAVVVNLDPEFEVRLNDALARLRCGSEEPFKELIREWAETDPEQALHWLMRSDNNVRFDRNVAMEIFRIMASKDPEKALALAKTPRFVGPYGDWMVFPVLGEWAKRDPRKAMRLFNEHVSDDSRDFLISELAPSIAKADPKLAAEFAMKTERLQYMPLYAILRNWAKQDLAAVTAWSETQSEDVQALALEATAASQQKEEHLGEALERILKLPESERDEQLMQAMRSSPILMGDGEIVFQMLELMSNHADPEFAYVLTKKWAKHGRRAAGEWVCHLEEGAFRQQAVLAYAQDLSMNVDGVAYWLGQIQDEKALRSIIEARASLWLYENETESRKVLQKWATDEEIESWVSRIHKEWFPATDGEMFFEE